jgi:hypothetical protein
MEDWHQWLIRYCDLCIWLDSIFPDFWIAEKKVVIDAKNRTLTWSKARNQKLVSLVFYGVKREFWDSTIAERLTSDYPEVKVVTDRKERVVLTFKYPPSLKQMHLVGGELIYYRTPVGVGKLARQGRRDDLNEPPGRV